MTTATGFKRPGTFAPTRQTVRLHQVGQWVEGVYQGQKDLQGKYGPETLLQIGSVDFGAPKSLMVLINKMVTIGMFNIGDLVRITLDTITPNKVGNQYGWKVQVL